MFMKRKLPASFPATQEVNPPISVNLSGSASILAREVPADNPTVLNQGHHLTQATQEAAALREEVNTLGVAYQRALESLQQRDDGIAWLRQELFMAKQELRQIKGSRLWPIMARGQRGLHSLIFLVLPLVSLLRHPLQWLTYQRWYWQTRTLIKRILMRVLPPALRKHLKRGKPQFYTPAELAALSNSPPAADASDPQLSTGYQALTLLPHLADEQLAALPQAFETTRVHRPDVVCFSIIDWDFRYQRPQQIMAQYAADGHRVFYLSTTNSLPSHTDPRVAVREVRENIYEVTLAAQRLPDVYGEVIQGINQQELMESLAELRRIFQIDAAVAYVMIASWGKLALAAGQQWGWQTIYDCMDEWENFPGISPAILQMERQLVKECDEVVVTAQRLYHKWQHDCGALTLARNGVDFDFYEQRCQPNNLLAKKEGQPVIGYYGAIADWFDIALMEYLAKERPQYQFILLGGVFDVDVSALRILPNVKLLGQQPYETMPQYLYHFDACIIPFKINPITEATDPVKLYEYLSGGKPVVATNMHELLPYHESVYLAKTHAEFVTKLDQALAEDSPGLAAQRRSFARTHTWQERYRAISQGLTINTPCASIIIVTWRNLVLTQLCLESVLRNTEYANYEIIVVDNNSDDGTPAYLQEMTARHDRINILLNQHNYGFAKANNQGIALSKGEYLVLLNNDTVVPPGWLNRLLLHLQDDSVGLVGPLTNAVGNEAKVEPDYRTWGEMETFAQQLTWSRDQQVADIFMLAMFCVALRRETYDRLGPLDEQFGIGMFEDDDYSQRIKADGLRVVCAADVFIHHFGQAAFKQLIANGTYNPLFEENRRRYEKKWKTEWIPHKHASLLFETRRPHRIDPSQPKLSAMHALSKV